MLLVLIEPSLQWNLYNSGDTLRTEEGVPWIDVSLEQRLGRGLSKINQQRIFLKNLPWKLLQVSFFKQINKKSQIIFLWQIVASLFLQVQ